jgi:hypothetical protein
VAEGPAAAGARTETPPVCTNLTAGHAFVHNLRHGHVRTLQERTKQGRSEDLAGQTCREQRVRCAGRWPADLMKGDPDHHVSSPIMIIKWRPSCVQLFHSEDHDLRLE